jgi:hypothetical protein
MTFALCASKIFIVLEVRNTQENEACLRRYPDFQFLFQRINSVSDSLEAGLDHALLAPLGSFF